MADYRIVDNEGGAGAVLTRIQLPLENIEFALEGYLRDNAIWLDPTTRDLLVAVRDGVGRVASQARALNQGSDSPPTLALGRGASA